MKPSSEVKWPAWTQDQIHHMDKCAKVIQRRNVIEGKAINYDGFVQYEDYLLVVNELKRIKDTMVDMFDFDISKL